MHFLDWLLEQQEEPGVAGVFGRLIYQDINNGCGLRYTEPNEWAALFSKKHPQKKDFLIGILDDAFISYLNRFNAEK